MPQEAAATPNDVNEQVAAVPNDAAGARIEHEDEASASNITTQLPDFSSLPAAVPLDTPKHRLVINLLPQVKTEEIEAAAPTVAVPMLPDLNHPTSDVEEEKHQEAAPPSALPTPSPEARVLLRRFASAMAARPAGVRVGSWSPEALGLTGRVADLRLHEADLPSSSIDEPLRR
ncbi:hypothetical protein D1007_23164 [Hordeum vulgare]|nr:hypothetical protein D1007_23164 [Hordeum vulgare]